MVSVVIDRNPVFKLQGDESPYRELAPKKIRVLAVRAWYGMERKFRYGIWKMPEWNGMEDFKNGMENNLPYFQPIPY